MLGFNLHWWETAMLVSLGFAAIAAALVGVATTAVVRLQREEVKESSVRIAEAVEGAAKANEQAVATAKANIELQTNLEKERIARLTLEKSLEPRRLSSEQKMFLTKALEQFKGQRTAIDSMLGDPESEQFARDFDEAFRAAGWKTDLGKAVYEPSPVGIHVYISQDDAIAERVPRGVTAMLEALLATKLISQKRLEGDKGIPLAGIKLIVGTKARKEK